MKWQPLVLAAALLLLFWSGAWGEYYQYTDKDGTVRFTDDASMIPEEKQIDVKTFESIQSPEPEEERVEEEPAPGEESMEETTDAASNETLEDAADETATTKGVDQKEEDELNAMREELHKTFAELEAEKAAIGPPPPKSAKSGVKADYTYRITELNRKIDDYQALSEEFDKKVKAFNRRR